jgi:hypothetical protein
MMVRWRAARDSGTDLPDDERVQLERLIDDEVRAAAELWRELAP